MRFDIEYITPAGISGTHYGVEASSVEEAMRLTPIMLAANTIYTPDQFTSVSAKLSNCEGK